MLKWSQKAKLRSTQQRIKLSVIANTRFVKTVAFWPLLPNLVENKTHVPTLLSLIRKQLSKSQSTK